MNYIHDRKTTYTVVEGEGLWSPETSPIENLESKLYGLNIEGKIHSYIGGIHVDVGGTARQSVLLYEDAHVPGPHAQFRMLYENQTIN